MIKIKNTDEEGLYFYLDGNVKSSEEGFLNLFGDITDGSLTVDQEQLTAIIERCVENEWKTWEKYFKSLLN